MLIHGKIRMIGQQKLKIGEWIEKEGRGENEKMRSGENGNC